MVGRLKGGINVGKSAKIAISLPKDFFEVVENERAASGESRSEFFRRAALIAIRQEKERAAIEQYCRAYERMPETTEEVEAAHRAGSSILAQEPWE